MLSPLISRFSRSGRGRRRSPVRGHDRSDAATPDTVTVVVDFTLPDERGASYRLADHLRTETVVVLFYRGDW